MQNFPTFSVFHLPILLNSSTVVPVNDFLSEPLTRKGCMVVGAFPPLAGAGATPPRCPRWPVRALAAGRRGVV